MIRNGLMANDHELTISNEFDSHLVILVHQTKVEGSTISDFVINVVKTASEENVDGFLDLRIFLSTFC